MSDRLGLQENAMPKRQQISECSYQASCLLGGPCPECRCGHCHGEGAVWYDPEGYYEPCDKCGGTGRYTGKRAANAEDTVLGQFKEIERLRALLKECRPYVANASHWDVGLIASIDAALAGEEKA